MIHNRATIRSLTKEAAVRAVLENSDMVYSKAELGYAKKTANDRARRVLEWTQRDPCEATAAAAKSMVSKGLLKA